MDPRTNKIDYFELGAKNAGDYGKMKAFYETAFGWAYTDYGSDYCDTKSSGVGSGINGGSEHKTPYPLPVLFAEDLEKAQQAVTAAGGIVTRPIFEFPGGRRFHFADPGGNELAVWSDR